MLIIEREYVNNEENLEHILQALIIVLRLIEDTED